ncbi:MAG: hypothetical protein GXP27_14505 [Planctomycetes bacterium]|nr:hypothetical protein [Planctomycetota bacterium]
MKLHLAAVVCCGVAAALWWAPPRRTETLRAAVRDAIGPAAAALQQVKRAVAAIPPMWSRSAELAERLRRVQAERDRWRIEAQRLAARLVVVREQADRSRQAGSPPTETQPSAPLVLADLVEARILGPGTSRLLQSGQLIGLGQNDGARDQALLLEPLPAIDQGTDVRMAPGLPVYAGRCVVGRIVKAGRWVSLIQPVTDKQYRGYAQLARRTSSQIELAAFHDTPRPPPEQTEELVFGARGLLEGTGTGLCRLTLVSRTEPVQVGDLVFTADRDGAFPYPMFYGTVVRTELPPGQPHWDILVKPAVTLDELHTVSVLRKRLNPDRAKQQTE